MQAKLVLKNTFIDFQSVDAEEDLEHQGFTRQFSEPARLPSKEECDNNEDVETEDGGSVGKKTSSESDGPEMCSDPSDGNICGQTLLLNNFPEHSTLQNLIDFLRDAGFEGTYDFLHVPMNAGVMNIAAGLDVNKHCGFAVVNFLNAAHAKAFTEMMDVLKFTSSKIVVTQAPIQGYAANYEYYNRRGFSPTKEQSLPPGQWIAQAQNREARNQRRMGQWSKRGEQAAAHAFVPCQRPWHNGLQGDTTMMPPSAPGAADAQRLRLGAASQQQLPMSPAAKRFCGWCGERRGMTNFCSQCGNAFDGQQQESQSYPPTAYMALPANQMACPATPVMWYGLCTA